MHLEWRNGIVLGLLLNSFIRYEFPSLELKLMEQKYFKYRSKNIRGVSILQGNDYFPQLMPAELFTFDSEEKWYLVQSGLLRCGLGQVQDSQEATLHHTQILSLLAWREGNTVKPPVWPSVKYHTWVWGISRGHELLQGKQAGLDGGWLKQIVTFQMRTHCAVLNSFLLLIKVSRVVRLL